MSSKYSPMNQALLDQILHQMRHGQVARCLDLGLDVDVLNQMNQPHAYSILKNAPVRWCRVEVDVEMIKQLLENCERDEREQRLIHRALKLGATNGMIRTFFGLSPSEISLLRQLFDAPGRSGRMAGVDDTDQIWYRFNDLMKQHDVEHTDAFSVLDICMLITEEQNGPQEEVDNKVTVAFIWNLVQTWINEGIYPPKAARAPLFLISDASRQRQRSASSPALATSLEGQQALDLDHAEGDQM
ncbi:STY4526/YPO1902 family pathogenicity island replication protein [uncultured Pseudomonas sp.]|uniref:STY4526/YPO1902 family pathogenicity island replication protein n=1 Tax=uncultured Pseudomonas sp. TaxID=114707 RepID=UPI0025D9B448|nr:STY4526/YPO1902 family pathogenicity island replication protein [uncultured Pseudomonas sp.]